MIVVKYNVHAMTEYTKYIEHIFLGTSQAVYHLLFKCSGFTATVLKNVCIRFTAPEIKLGFM